MGHVTAAVREMYERFPYPQVDMVAGVGNLREEINMVTGRCVARPLQDDSKILVAGCGTREAVHVSLAFPRASIDAVDISERSLEISRDLAVGLGLKNINFIQMDLMEMDGLEGGYDYITSSGVLHHLEDPLKGLRNLKKLLTSDGLLHLMLYSRNKRYYIKKMQDLVKMLSGDDPSLDRRLRVAAALVENLEPNVWPMGFYLDLIKAKERLRENLPDFTDSFINPNETHYTIPSLMGFLKEGGFSFLGFSSPGDWDVETLLKDEDLVEMARSLPPHKRFELVDEIASPFYDFYAQHKEASWSAEKPCDLDGDLFLGIVPKMVSNFVYRRGGSGEVSARPARTELKAEPFQHPTIRDLVKIRFGQKEHVCHKITLDFINLTDGEKSIREITDRVAKRYGISYDALELGAEKTFRNLFYLYKMAVPHKCPACRSNG